MRYLILLLFMVSAAVQAEVYKSTNDKGEVIYSDIPSRGAERVKLPDLPTYTPPPVPASTSRADRKSVQDAIYQSFSFRKPGNDETVRNNLGIIMIETRLAPALQTKLGHRIQFYLNGKPAAPLLDRTAITLSNIERGAHTLSASVLDKDGKVLVSTGDVTVHVKRESARHEDDDYSILDDQPVVDHIPEDDRDRLDPVDQPDETPYIRDRTPNLRVEQIPDPENPDRPIKPTPNIRTDTPNLRKARPNLRNSTPNIINPPAPPSGGN